MDSIKRFFRRDRDYFTNNKSDIRWQNYKTLKIACAVYMVILLVYTGMEFVRTQEPVLRYLYIGVDLLHIILCFFVFGCANKSGGVRTLYICKVVFTFSVLLFFLVEAIFPYPDKQSTYYPFPLILIAMIFARPFWQSAALVVGDVAVFLMLVFLFKSPEIWSEEIFVATGTIISAGFGSVIATTMRHEMGGAVLRLRYLSMTDPMTGLYNKQTFESLCRSYIKDKPAKNYAVLFMDVDRFKQINDQFGHPFGDAVLKGIAQVLKDIFYDKDYLCRFGGDEFVVFMVDNVGEKAVGERVKAFESRMRALARTLRMETLSCSVGIAYKQKGETYSELLSRADAALYVAKESGKRKMSFSEAEPAILGGAEKKTVEPGVQKSLRRVLVVDDNEMNRSLLCKILETSYLTMEAVNGQEALELLREHKQEISAVLLDLQMPVMDGYELLGIMRSEEALSAIPVIITTGHSEEDAEVKSLALGANDFIVKPYRPAIIMHRLQNCINLKEASAQLTEKWH